MQRLMRFVQQIYIWRLGYELKQAQREHRFHTQDIKQLYAMQRRVQSATQNTYPLHLIAQVTANIERYEAVIVMEADTIKELQAEIKAEKKKRASSEKHC